MLRSRPARWAALALVLAICGATSAIGASDDLDATVSVTAEVPLDGHEESSDTPAVSLLATSSSSSSTASSPASVDAEGTQDDEGDGFSINGDDDDDEEEENEDDLEDADRDDEASDDNDDDDDNDNDDDEEEDATSDASSGSSDEDDAVAETSLLEDQVSSGSTSRADETEAAGTEAQMPAMSSTAHLSWAVTRGPPVRSISVLAGGRALGVTRWGRAVRYDAKQKRWSRIAPRSARIRSISVGCRGTAYAVTTRGVVVRRDPDVAEWQPMFNETAAKENGRNETAPPAFRSVSAGSSDGDVFAVTFRGELYKYHLANATFVPLRGRFRKVSVGCDGEETGSVYAVTPARDLYRLIDASSSRWIRVARGIRDVAVGKRIIVLDSRRRAFHYVPRGASGSERARRKMTPLFVRLLGAGAGADGSVFGIRTDGRVMRRVIEDPERDNLGIEAAAVLRRMQGGTWTPVGGAKGIVLGSSPDKSSLYGVTRDGKLKRHVREDTWADVPVPSPVARVSVACDGTTVVITTRSLRTFRGLGNGKWAEVHETLLRTSAGRDHSQVWGINAARQLVLFNNRDGKFAVQRGKRVLRSISAGCDSQLWAVTRSGRVISRTSISGRWTKRARGARAVAHGRETYVLGRRGMLYKYVPGRRGARARRGRNGRRGRASRALRPMYKRLRRVFTNADGELYGIDMRWRLVRFRARGRRSVSERWRRVGVKLTDICVGSRTSIYGVQGSTVLRWHESTGSFAIVPAPPLRRLHCGCDGTVWGTNFRSGSIYRLRDPKVGWERVPGSSHVGRVSVAKKGVAWGVARRGGAPVEWDDAALKWMPRAGKLRDIAVGCEGELLGIGRGGGVWERDPATSRWLRLGAGARRVSVGAGKAYVIGKRGHLFERSLGSFTSSAPPKFKVIGRARRVSAAADGTVWAIDHLGNAYMVHHELRAELPELPHLKVKRVSDRAPEAPAQPDGAAPDPFRAGSDPVAVALRKIDRKLSTSDMEKIAQEGGNEVENAAIIDRFPEAPKPSVAPEARYGENIDPQERLEQSELVSSVHMGWDEPGKN